MTDRVLLTRLYERTSKFGNRYFVGRLGAARLLLFRDNHGPEPNIWELLTQPIQEREHKPLAQAAAQARAAGHAAGAGGLQAQAEVLRAAAVPEISRPKLKRRADQAD